jgi:nicotinamide mononucleotide (NMN) deamidase PncC
VNGELIEPAGTVRMAVHYRGQTASQLSKFDGDPQAVCDQTCAEALSFVLQRLR